MCRLTVQALGASQMNLALRENRRMPALVLLRAGCIAPLALWLASCSPPEQAPLASYNVLVPAGSEEVFLREMGLFARDARGQFRMGPPRTRAFVVETNDFLISGVNPYDPDVYGVNIYHRSDSSSPDQARDIATRLKSHLSSFRWCQDPCDVRREAAERQ